MFCKNCGSQNQDNDLFCHQCGMKLTQNNINNMHIVQNEQIANGDILQQEICTYISLCKSPLSFIAVIIFSAALLLNIIGLLLLLGDINNAFNVLDSLPGNFISFSNYFSDYITRIVIGALIARIPNMLVITGLWLNFVYVMKTAGSYVKTTGLTIIKTSLIIKLICACIICAFIGLILLVASGYDDNVVMIILAAIIIMAGNIFYYIKLIKTINSMKIVASAGKSSYGVSVYAAVITFIIGFFTLLYVFVPFINIAFRISYLCNSAAYVMFGILIFIYRSKIKSPVITYIPQAVPVPDSPAEALPSAGISNGSARKPDTQIPAASTVHVQTAGSPVITEPASTAIHVTLLRVKTNETIQITSQSFRIGKQEDMDYRILDNNAISRVHANIIYYNGKYYIMDLGSRNGTYVNGVRIGTNSSLEISNGSRLLLADEEFYIQITNGAR